MFETAIPDSGDRKGRPTPPLPVNLVRNKMLNPIGFFRKFMAAGTRAPRAGAHAGSGEPRSPFFFDAQSAQTPLRIYSKQTTYRKLASFRLEAITHHPENPQNRKLASSEDSWRPAPVPPRPALMPGPANAARLFFSDAQRAQSAQKPMHPYSKQMTYRKLASFRLENHHPPPGESSESKIGFFRKFAAAGSRAPSIGAHAVSANAARLYFSEAQRAQSAQKPMRPYLKQMTYRKLASFRLETITHHPANPRNRKLASSETSWRQAPVPSTGPSCRVRRTPLAYFFFEAQRAQNAQKADAPPIRNK